MAVGEARIKQKAAPNGVFRLQSLVRTFVTLSSLLVTEVEGYPRCCPGHAYTRPNGVAPIRITLPNDRSSQ